MHACTVDLFDVGGRAFRARLKRELPLWRSEGLVDEAVTAALSRRYRLEERGWKASVAAIYGLGAALVGLGIVSFVAWNWESLTGAGKLTIVGGAMVAAHLLGYWLWQVSRISPRLGHAVVVLGTLILGATIGLVGQIFHLEGEWWEMCGPWALGAAAAAWTLRSVPNALLGVALGTIWGSSLAVDGEKTLPIPAALLAATFLPLAWVARSRLLSAATFAGVGIAASSAAGAETRAAVGLFAPPLALAALLVAAPFASSEESRLARWTSLGATLGIATWSVCAYFLSFHGIAEDAKFGSLRGESLRWIALPSLCVLAAAAALLRGIAQRRIRWGEHSASILALAGTALLLGAMALPETEVPLAVAANAALALFCADLIVTAVRSVERGRFWLGVLLSGVLVLSRFFEFETHLLLKAAAFVVGGLAVIAVGVAFERRVRARASLG
jgi:uncharacterized membrane protein